MRHATTLLTIALLAGCAGAPKTPSGAPATTADLGPRPKNQTALFATYLNATLKDPMSAQLAQIAGPAPLIKEGTWGTSKAAYGWGTCYTVNAKNSFGGYTGAKWYIAVTRDEKLVDVIGPSGASTIFEDDYISRFCNSAR